MRSTVRSDFTFKVLLSTLKIPPGNVVSYKDIADITGYKGAYRAVGNALAGNPYLIDIPCHRVVCSNGTLGGFKKGRTAKRRLLEREGIIFDRKGRIPRRFFVRF